MFVSLCDQCMFFMLQTLHVIGSKYLNMLFTIHGLTCKFNSPAKLMSLLLEHLVSCHGWTPEDVSFVKKRLPKSMQILPSKPKPESDSSRHMSISIYVFMRTKISVQRYTIGQETERDVLIGQHFKKISRKALPRGLFHSPTTQ